MKYLLEMLERKELKNKTIFIKTHYFELDIKEKLNEEQKNNFALRLYPDYIYRSLTPIKNKLPSGWRVIKETLTDPNGYKWICNNKSVFDKNYKKALLKL